MGIIEDNWGQQIKRLREERGFNLSELAKRSGLSHASLSKMERGISRKPQQLTFEKLAKGLNMTVDNLIKELKGKSPSRRQETPEDILERLRVSISSTVPIYEEYRVHYGEPVEIIDYVSIVKERAKGKRLEGYIGHGECLSPIIEDGDIVIIDRDGQIDNGDIVACLVEGELHIARLKRIAGELYLENNHGRIKLESDAIAHPVIEVRRRLK